MAISAATLGEDSKTVSLEFPGLRPVTNLIVKYSLRSAAGAKLQSERPSRSTASPIDVAP